MAAPFDDRLADVEPLCLRPGIAFAGQGEGPLRSVGRQALHGLRKALRGLVVGHRGVQFRFHPERDFFLKKTQGTGQEHGIQQPAE